MERNLLPVVKSIAGANALPIDEAPLIALGRRITGRYGLMPVANVVENPHSVRTHRRRQVEKIARSMEVAGALAPAIVDEGCVLLAGHARLSACRLRHSVSIPVVQVFGLSEGRKRAFLLADNRLAEDAGWDRAALAAQMPELKLILQDDDLVLDDTGFEAGEVDELIADFTEELDDGDAIPPAGPRVLRVGDLVTLGRHRLLVGDARDPEALDRLCAGAIVAGAFLDPPYNVSGRAIGGRGRVKHENFVMAAGEMSSPEFVEFLRSSLSNGARVSGPGAVFFVCIDGKHIRDLLEAGQAALLTLIDVVVWNKTNAGQGGLYRQQHELIAVFSTGDIALRNNVQKGKFGRNRSNVWTYPGANTFRKGRHEDLVAHPTVKPLRLVADALKDVTQPDDVVLDTFAGSGTTILAAERVGRRALAMELDPGYADTIVRRWQAATGRDAVDEASGLTFDELEAERGRAAGTENAVKLLASPSKGARRVG